MTAPGQQIIHVPGAGEEVAQGLQPLIQAMQFNRQLALQQQEHENTIAAQMLAHMLQTPGAESSPAFGALATKLGVPTLGPSIAKARSDEERRKIDDINTYTEGLSGLDDKSKSALRVSLIAGVKGATADIQNSLFSAMATGGDLSTLEQARLDNLRANTAHIQAQINKMKTEPGPMDQQHAAEILHVPPQDFVQGANYVDVLESILKQKEADPGRTIVNTAVQLMTQFRDIIGRPTITPPEALEMSRNLYRSLFPKAAAAAQLTPETAQQLSATRDALQIWQGVIADEYEVKDAQGRVLKKFKNDGDVKTYLGHELKTLYPLIDDASLNLLLDVVQRRVHE